MSRPFNTKFNNFFVKTVQFLLDDIFNIFTISYIYLLNVCNSHVRRAFFAFDATLAVPAQLRSPDR